MYDDDVVIKIKADIDARQTKKEFEEIAKNSKTAIEHSFKSLELTMRKSMEDVSRSMGRDIDIDPFVENFRVKMKELYKEIQNTGNLPKGMNSKLLDAMQHVDALIGRYFALNKAIGKMGDEFDTVTAQQKKDINETIASLEKQREYYRSAAEEAKTMQEKYMSYQSLLKDFTVTRGTKTYTGGDALQDYEIRKQKIEETKQKINELQQAVNNGLIPKSDIAETEKEIDKLTYSLNSLINVQKKIDSTSAEYLIGLREHLKESTDFTGIKEALGSDNPIKELASYATEAKATVDSLTRGIERENDALSQVNSTSLEQDENFRRMSKDVDNVRVEIVKAATHVNELEEAALRAGSSMSQWRNVVWSVSRVLGNVYTIGLDFARTAKTIANIYKNIWGYLKKIASIFTKLRDSIKGTAKEHAKSWKDMLRDVLRYSFGIRSLFALFRRLRRYIKEAFEEMAKQIPEVNKVLSELKSSLGMLKGSLATAFEPIISAVAPALNFLIEKLAQVMTYIGMFFAALTGRGYVYKATKSMQDFAKATKEANKQLQGFDELNNLTTNKDNGAEDAPMAIFKKVPVPDWIKDLADKIKAILMRIIDPIKKAWARIGPYVVAAWRRAFYNVKKLLMDIGRDFLKAWDEMGQSISEHFLEIVGDIGNIIANIAEALDTAWNANENGYRIWKAILTIVDKVLIGVRNITTDMVIWTHDLDVTPAMTAFADWFESLEPIVETLMNILFDFWDHALKPILTWAFDGENSGIARLFKILKDFNDKLDTEKIRGNLDKVWQALGRFGQTVGEGLLIFLERMSDRIANWANGDKFESLCDSIVEFLDNIEPEDVADDLEQLLDTVLNLAGQVKDAIMFVVNHKDEILNLLEFASEHLKGILQTVISFKTVIDFARLGANLFLMATAMEKLQGMGGIGGFIAKFKEGDGIISKAIGLLSGLSSTVLIVIGVIVALVAAIVVLYNKSEEFRAGVDKGIQTIKDAFANFMEGLKPSLDVLKETLAPLFDLIKSIAAYVVEHLPQILSVVGNIVGGVIELVGYAIRFIGDVINMIVSLIAGVFAALTGNTEGFCTSMKNLLKSFIDAILSFLSLALGVNLTGIVDKALAATLRAFQKFGQGVKDIFISIKNGMKNIVNGIITIIENLANCVISGVNGAIGALNNMKFNIPSWVPGVGGQSFNLNIPKIATRIQLPRLAEGAVIPPNKEFLAVLGDQKSGTNIESPLSTMVEAFNQAGGNRSEQELTLLQEQNQLLRQLIEKEWSISASQMFNAMQRQAVVYTKQSGKPAFS